jgi:hypothetical protein
LDSSAGALNDARGQLGRIEQRLRASHGELYHDLALHAQVLREGLLPAVRQAVFHLATQVVPERYAELDPHERRRLQEHLALLVQRCGSLLTLEQLIVLARQIQDEQQRQRRRDQRRLLERLEAEAPARRPRPGEAAIEPRGSVQLRLDLPLSAELFSSGVPGLAGLGALTGGGDGNAQASEDDDDGDNGQEPDDDNDNDEDQDELEEDDGEEDDEEEDDGTGPLGDDAAMGHGGPDVMQTLFALASASLGRQPPPGTGEADPPADAARSAATTFLPGQPLELLRWWAALDQAIQRRLRNLSHAVNLELLRLGLCRSLLPVSLLEAVLEGRIDPMPAPANLLRLVLPFAPQGGQFDTLAVLLRTSDLEYEQPRLRSCRRRLERRRAEVRKMAQQYRHWQRRARALEAERQWLQDDQATPPTPP